MLPGRNGGERLCRTCAGITTDLDCTRCGTEAERHRRGICARCALRDDLVDLLSDKGGPRPELLPLIDVLCASARPESIHTWKRHPDVVSVLTGMGTGQVPLTHEAIDQMPGRAREHLRELLVHHKLIPQRDRDLAHFDSWLTERLNTFTAKEIRQPLEQFAKWHHLRKIRHKAARGDEVHGSVHSAKQEITEVGRPNLQTGNAGTSPWLFPSTRAGHHLAPKTIMDRLRGLGIDLLGARNATLRELVQQVPPPIVASQLGYGPPMALRHAALVAQPDAQYAALTAARLRDRPRPRS
jgi:hypothetical protein